MQITRTNNIQFSYYIKPSNRPRNANNNHDIINKIIENFHKTKEIS